MTAQYHDGFDWGEECFSISAIEFPQRLLDIEALGLHPKTKDSTCKRGYTAIFRLDDTGERLLLDRLYTNNGKKEAPVIGGVAPVPLKSPAGNVYYKNLNLPIAYTGGIVITTDFIGKLIVHHGFQPPENFKKVWELTFDNGRLVKKEDLSLLAEIRRLENKIALRKARERGEADGEVKEMFKNALLGEANTWGKDKAWIERCYDISYDAKYVFHDKE